MLQPAVPRAELEPACCVRRSDLGLSSGLSSGMSVQGIRPGQCRPVPKPRRTGTEGCVESRDRSSLYVLASFGIASAIFGPLAHHGLRTWHASTCVHMRNLLIGAFALRPAFAGHTDAMGICCE